MTDTIDDLQQVIAEASRIQALSPAAQAVLNAAYALPFKNHQPSIAAALRAAASQLTSAKAIDTLRAIADELEGLAGPAVPTGSELPSIAQRPSDKELLDLIPEAMREEFAYASETCSGATGGQVKPEIFRSCLNTVAVEYARAVLAHFRES